MIPTGWYFCAESSEIKPKKIMTMQLFNQKVILWRTESGVLNMSSSVCPHLGSDLSVLGSVQGEHLKCFSHDYTYNTQGDCVATGFQQLPRCHKNVLKSFPVQEVNGFVIAWYDNNNNMPTWAIPETVFSLSSKAFVRSDFTFKVPLTTLNEDNFDVGHLYKWHNVHSVKTTPVVVNGPTISIAHAFKRHSIVFKKPLKKPFDFLSREIDSRYSSTLHGHGLTDSFIDIFNLNIRLHDLIWCTPITPTITKYTTFLRLVKSDHRSLKRRIFDAFVFRASVLRLRQEHRHEGHGFWERQSPVIHPILTEPEHALIDPYRAWCKQFESGIKNENIT